MTRTYRKLSDEADDIAIKDRIGANLFQDPRLVVRLAQRQQKSLQFRFHGFRDSLSPESWQSLHTFSMILKF